MSLLFKTVRGPRQAVGIRVNHKQFCHLIYFWSLQFAVSKAGLAHSQEGVPEGRGGDNFMIAGAH